MNKLEQEIQELNKEYLKLRSERIGLKDSRRSTWLGRLRGISYEEGVLWGRTNYLTDKILRLARELNHINRVADEVERRIKERKEDEQSN